MYSFAVIVYHKNVLNYPAEWINTFVASIEYQTFQDFDILELNYGGGDERLFDRYFDSIEMSNHAEAMNYLIDRAFALGYTHVFNTNVDDWYSLDRFEKQVRFTQYDVVSSNFTLVDEFTGNPYHTHYFSQLNIKRELDKGHNVICHPVVMISKKYWETHRYNPSEVPLEDMKLWQRGGNFVILPEVLCYHRVHRKSVGHGG